MEALVVGGGIMGLTAAWALARAGISVQLFEAATPGRACYYTVTADERFLVEPIDANARSWRLAGFSGHGFKFAAALGLRLADSITNRRDPRDLSAWAAGRLP